MWIEEKSNGVFPLIPLQRKRGSSALATPYTFTVRSGVSINSASKEAWERTIYLISKKSWLTVSINSASKEAWELLLP